MYPTISDLIFDLTGIYIPLPIQTFGFFVALAFYGAAWVLTKELKRLEKEGKVFPVSRKVRIGAPASWSELGTSTLIGFIIGYKLFFIISNYSFFVADPQSLLLSLEGNWFGGIVIGLVYPYLKYRQKEKKKLKQPKWESVVVHPYEMVFDLTLIALIAGLIGAKLFHNLEYIHEFMADPLHALLSFSGLTFYGGLIFGAIGVLYYSRKQGIPFLHLLDALAPALMLAYGIGRIGCQLSGDGDWGIVNTMPQPEWLSFLPEWAWAYSYPHNVLGQGIPIEGCTGAHCYQLANPVFPTPLYESVGSLMLFGILWAMRKKLPVPGMLLGIYLIFNGMERFLIEKIRVNAEYIILGNRITQAEIISTFLVIGGLAVLYVVWKNRHFLTKKDQNPNASPSETK